MKAPEELVLVFNRFDKDGDGEINVSDLAEMFREVGHVIELEEVHDMLYILDKDEDGTLNFSEFIQIMMFDTQDESLNALEEQRQAKRS